MNLVKPESITTTGAITRSTIGTYFDIAGIMQTAAIDAVRINYDPYTHEFLGLLIENATTNLLLQSQDFDNASYWSKTRTTITANAVLAPDNTTTADKLIEDTTASSSHYISQNQTLTANLFYTMSVYAKAAERSRIVLRVGNSGSWVAGSAAVGFDLSTGILFSVSGDSTSSGTIQPVGNGWYRCSITAQFGATTTSGGLVINLDDGTGITYTGNGTSGVYIWGSQLEAGSTISSYIKTTTAAVTRAADNVTGSGLVYTNLTNAYAEWSSGTTYALGTSVSYGILGTYISLQNSNLNQNPVTATTYWLRTGPTNKMAAFDDQISSVSSANSDIIFAVTASSIDTVALLNVVGSKTSIAVTDISLKSEIYHNSQQLTGIDSLDWYSYFFYDQDTVRTLSVYLDIPVVSSGLVTVKISGAGTNSLGTFIAGLLKRLGDTQYGVSAGIIDYSRKDTDEFGNVTFIKRNYSKRINASVSLTNANLNNVQRILYQIRATPVLWLASTDIQFEEPLITYGFYRDFSTEISYPTHSICNLQIEGLI
jgi:hypothetical protein